MHNSCDVLLSQKYRKISQNWSKYLLSTIVLISYCYKNVPKSFEMKQIIITIYSVNINLISMGKFTELISNRNGGSRVDSMRFWFDSRKAWSSQITMWCDGMAQIRITLVVSTLYEPLKCCTLVRRILINAFFCFKENTSNITNFTLIVLETTN